MLSDYWMKKIKNPTPRDVALASAVLIGLWVFFCLLAIQWIYRTVFSWGVAVLFSLCTAWVAYLAIIYLLRPYIYRKVKLIYKLIDQQKKKNRGQEKAMDLGKDVLAEVERDVGIWIQHQNQELDRLKSWQNYRRRFLGDISHELKTPVFNIQGYLDVLLQGGLEDASINRRYLERAVKNTERLSNIIQDLEAISRMEAGELILEMSDFSIRDLVQEVFEDLEMKASKKNIALRFKRGADYAFRVRADKDNIRQVLVNLVNNSIKYGREGGLTTVAFYDMDSYLLVEVADNGIGIKKKHLPRIFERFFRVDKSRSREQGGTGLGLAIVKHIIEAHGQRITVRSSPGVGTTFGFTLKKAN